MYSFGVGLIEKSERLYCGKSDVEMEESTERRCENSVPDLSGHDGFD